MSNIGKNKIRSPKLAVKDDLSSEGEEVVDWVLFGMNKNIEAHFLNECFSRGDTSKQGLQAAIKAASDTSKTTMVSAARSVCSEYVRKKIAEVQSNSSLSETDLNQNLVAPPNPSPDTQNVRKWPKALTFLSRLFDIGMWQNVLSNAVTYVIIFLFALFVGCHDDWVKRHPPEGHQIIPDSLELVYKSQQLQLEILKKQMDSIRGELETYKPRTKLK